LLSRAVRALLAIPVPCLCGVLVAGCWCLGGRGVFVNWIVDASI
jgi:hypothetical protein